MQFISFVVRPCCEGMLVLTDMLAPNAVKKLLETMPLHDDIYSSLNLTVKE